MAINRARGWRRIGIVLSVIWFVGFGGYMWKSEVSPAVSVSTYYRLAKSMAYQKGKAEVRAWRCRRGPLQQAA